MTISHIRAAILEKTISKFRAAGVPIDADPILHDWLQSWVDGGLKMSDIAQRYQDLLTERLVSKNTAALPTAPEYPQAHGSASVAGGSRKTAGEEPLTTSKPG